LHRGKRISLRELPEKYRTEDCFLEEPPEAQSCAVQTSAPDATAAPEAVWSENGLDFNALISDFEDKLILQALSKTGGNKKEAARLLNLKRTTLIEKIKKKNLEG
jgi:DNA-binding NtrC family response regulator